MINGKQLLENGNLSPIKGLNLNTGIAHYYQMSQLAWAQREKLVMEMYKEGVRPKEIAHQLKMSLRDIYKIINKNFGAKEKELTTEHQAILLFMKGKRPIDVAIKLRINLEEACRHYTKYKESFYLGKFGQDYKYIRGYMPQLAEICNVMKNAGLKVKEVIDEYNAYISMNHDLAEMENMKLYLINTTNTLKQEKAALEGGVQRLKDEVEALESRLSLTKEFLDYPAHSADVNYNNYQNSYPSHQYAGYQIYPRYY